MITIIRRATSVGVVAVLATFSLSACSSATEATGSDDMLHIGIAQIVAHPALDSAREGFKRALEDNGYREGVEVTYDEQNAQGDIATATTIAASFVADDLDLILAISTPMAQAISNAEQDVPVLATAASLLEAELIDSMELPGGNITGTTDFTPMDIQLELVRELGKDAQTLGVIYSSAELNSQEQVSRLKEAAQEFGIEIVEATVTNSGEVQQAAQSLDVDAFYIPLDNTLATAMPVVEEVAAAKGIPIVAGDSTLVESGAIASRGVNYEDLGYQTGKMAVEILKGANPAEIPVQLPEQYDLTINLVSAERVGVEVPQSLLDKADTVIKE